MTELDTFAQLLQFLVPIVALIAGVKWGIAKQRLSSFRKLVDSVDDAVADDKVTESEFQKIWNNFRKVIS